jgi:hypothetical protein
MAVQVHGDVDCGMSKNDLKRLWIVNIKSPLSILRISFVITLCIDQSAVDITFYLKKDYNNAMKRRTKAVSILEALPEESVNVRYRYQDLVLVNMLMIARDTENDSFDSGCCKFAAGVIALKEGKAVQAEKNLLEAERIFTLSVGKDSAYLQCH